MLLQPPPGTAAWLRIGLDQVLVVHIAAGGLAVAAGYAALSLRKGARWHRLAGDVFFGAMCVMSGLAVWIGLVMAERANVFTGGLTLYLAVTGWSAARGRMGGPRSFEFASLAFALALAGAGAFGAARVWSHAQTPLRVEVMTPFYAAVAAAAAFGDLQAIRRGLAGPRRIARHLWRMCAALVIAAAFFVLQPRIFPTPVPALVAAAAAPLAVMAVHLARIWRAGRTRRARAPARAGPVGDAAATRPVRVDPLSASPPRP